MVLLEETLQEDDRGGIRGEEDDAEPDGQAPEEVEPLLRGEVRVLVVAAGQACHKRKRTKPTMFVLLRSKTLACAHWMTTA